MTIVRLEGGLFIHSPTVLSPTLRAAIDDLGTPQWIIGPNTIHYWWVGEWKRAFPNACVFLAPGIPKRAKRRVDSPFEIENASSRERECQTVLISVGAV